MSMPALASTGGSPTAAQSSVAIQAAVMKKAMASQASSVMTLVQSVPPAPAPATGELPLATSGTLGTRLNVRA